MSKNALFILGLIASIAAGIAGAAKDFPPPWNYWLILGGLAGTAVNGMLHTRPRHEWSEEKREEKREEQRAEERAAIEEPEA